MSKGGKLVGSFANLCIFETDRGYFVRSETVHRVRAPSGRLVTKRHYKDIHTIPAPTVKAANEIIGQVLGSAFSEPVELRRLQ